MKALKLIFLLTALNVSVYSQLTGFFDDFEDGTVDLNWNGSPHTLWIVGHQETYGIIESNGILSIAYDHGTEDYIWSNFSFTPPEAIDVSGQAEISLNIKSDVAFTCSIKPRYSNGNDGWLHKEVPGDNSWHRYTFQLLESNYAGGYLQRVYFYFDGGSSEAKSGSVEFDDFKLAGNNVRVKNLQSLLVDSSKVDLVWDTDMPELIDYYNIYRSTINGFSANEENKIGETPELIFHDTGLSNYTTYYYQVAVTDTAGEEHPSSKVSIRTSTPGAIPQPKIVGVNTNPVGKYEKFEILVSMPEANFHNPYNPDDIDLFAWFHSPDGDSIRINGFYDNYMNQDQWKIRFAAGKPGTWYYQLFARDLDGTGSSGKMSLTVVESTNKGWLHIAPENPNYLMHDDGSSFYGISLYYPWAVSPAGLDKFKALDGNFFGYWDCTFDREGNGGGRYLLESMESGLGRYDQNKAARIDEVLSMAEERKMKVMLAIWTHPYLRVDNVPWPDGYWYEQNPYQEIVEPEGFFTDSLALSYQEKHHRYLIARFGYSQSLGIWEIINEAHGTTSWVRDREKTKKWVTAVHSYFKENDPYNRPTTASFGGGSGADHFTAGGQLGDMPNIHFYELHGWPNLYPDNPVRSGLANVVSESRKLKSKGDRPAFFGEAGYYYMLTDANTEAYTREFHNSFWAGLTNGLASTPFWWQFGYTDILTTERLQDYSRLSRFVSDIDFAHQYFVPKEISLENTDAYFMESATSGFGWMRSFEEEPLGNIPLSITESGINNGTYLMEWFNTWSGEVMNIDTAYFVEGLTWGQVVPGETAEPDVAWKLSHAGAGESASQVRLQLLEADTISADSVNYRFACYVTDMERRMDTSCNEEVIIDIDGTWPMDPYSLELKKGGVIFDTLLIGFTGAILTVTLEGVGSTAIQLGEVEVVSEGARQADHLEFELNDAYPNPFDYVTCIKYKLPENLEVKLLVFNVQGQWVETLVDGQMKAGMHQIQWKAENYPAGIYYMTLTSRDYMQTKRCVILR